MAMDKIIERLVAMADDGATADDVSQLYRRRRFRKDGTVDLDGRVWQLDQGFLSLFLFRRLEVIYERIEHLV